MGQDRKENARDEIEINAMTIVGLGGLQGDGACAVMRDGTLRAAIEESKINRGPRR